MRFTRMLALIAFAAFILPVPAHSQSDEKAQLKEKLVSAWSAQDWEGVIAVGPKLSALDPTNGQVAHHVGYAYHMLGKLDDALPYHLKAAESKQFAGIGYYNAACVYSLKKENDNAFTHLAKAVDAGFGDVDQISGDSDFNNIRGDARYKDLLGKIKDKPAKIQAFVQNTPRLSSRIAFFKRGGAGQIYVDHGPVKWGPTAEKAANDPELMAKRWRLGSDFWTTFDTALPIEINGTKIAPGTYYLVLSKKTASDFLLTFLDPNAIRATKLDPFQADKTTGGIDVSIKHSTAASSAPNLVISLSMDDGSDSKGKFTIHLGPHQLDATLTIDHGSKS